MTAAILNDPQLWWPALRGTLLASILARSCSMPVIRTFGAEFKAWENSDWGSPDAWWDDYQLFVNGEEVGLDYDTSTIPDDATVEVHDGVLFLDAMGKKDMHPKTHFDRWKKAQTNAAVLVDLPKGKLEELKAAVKALGGKVIEKPAATKND